MASPRFIRKTDLAGLAPLTVRDQPVIEGAEGLRGFIAEHAGPQAADLFAEPVVTRGNDAHSGSVSWYAPILGDPVPLSQLDGAGRGGAEALLRDRLRLLEPLLDDPNYGLALRNALVVPDLGDVLVSSDDVVITNWGLAPSAAARDPRAKLELLRNGLGRYAPFANRMAQPTFFSEIDRGAAPQGTIIAPQQPPQAARPPRAVAAPPAGAAGPAAGAGGGRGAPPAAPPPRQPQGPQGPQGPRPPQRTGGLVPIASFLIILLVAILGLGLGFWFGWNALLSELQGLRRNAVNQQAIEEAIRSQRQTNDELRRRIAAARDLLQRDICTIDNPLGLQGSADATPTSPTALPPPQQPFQGSLADLMDRAVVLVLTKRGSDLGLGSGFFVGPDLVLTNQHVAEQGQGGSIFVTNRLLGGVRPAEIVAMTPNHDQFHPDFALLRIGGPPVVPPVLAITTSINRLDNVIAAGFPGIVVMTDAVFARLIQGDAQAIPETVVAPGEVTTVQNDQLSQRVLHTAAIAQGNSGGPLIDRCGRVLGVNTMMQIDQQQLARVNYALGSDTIVAFLRANNITPSVLNTPCQAGQVPITAPAMPQQPMQPAQATPPSGPPTTPPTTPPSTPPTTPTTPPTNPPPPVPAPPGGPTAPNPPGGGTPQTPPAAAAPGSGGPAGPATPAAQGTPAVPPGTARPTPAPGAAPPAGAAPPPATGAATPPATPPAPTSPAQSGGAGRPAAPPAAGSATPPSAPATPAAPAAGAAPTAPAAPAPGALPPAGAAPAGAAPAGAAPAGGAPAGGTPPGSGSAAPPAAGAATPAGAAAPGAAPK
jgi:S1-C subfamily serine protease